MFDKAIAQSVSMAAKLYTSIINLKTKAEAYNDPDIALRANTVREYFVGYPYIVQLHFKEEYVDDIGKTVEIIRAWCLENCADKFAHNIHRVILSSNYSGVEEWTMNDIGGRDLWFWAFKNEYDATLFALRW